MKLPYHCSKRYHFSEKIVDIDLHSRVEDIKRYPEVLSTVAIVGHTTNIYKVSGYLFTIFFNIILVLTLNPSTIRESERNLATNIVTAVGGIRVNICFHLTSGNFS